MGTVDPPQTWAPYENNRDCSRGFCSIYCPQWCYIVFPPPPPFGYQSDDSSEANFSPLVIAIIGILASAFLLVSYYTVVSKYCGNFDSLRRSQGDSNEEFDGTRTPSGQEGWQVTGAGLDEALIKSITVCKYKRGEGLVEGTDCSVCLSEFLEDESLRLLPKCSHAFHVPCIDTWLKSHSNCPLCRANIVSPCPLPLQLPAPARPEMSPVYSPENDAQREDDTNMEDMELGRGEMGAKSPVRALSNLEEINSIIEIREEIMEPVRRSVSMDYSRHDHISIADVLEMSMEDETHVKDGRLSDGEGSSRTGVGDHSKGNSRNRGLHSVMSPAATKRASSSGRFSSTRHGKGRGSVLPM